MQGWPGRVVLAAIACSALATHARAQSAEPQPRVAYDMHSARINQIRATPDLQRLVTVSQDKTLRVWRIRDLALMRAIPVPSEAGDEGALRAVAPTADGRDAVVGGWTGLSWPGGARLYQVELTSGRLKRTLRGFPGVIESLAFNRDGSRLAVGLGGTAGLQVLSWPGGEVIARDPAYGERVTFVDFAPDGTLATTSADGCLRLYDAGLRLIFRADYPPSAQPGPACRGGELGGVRFSPDGRRLAFGLQDRPQLVVMDVARQAVERVLTVDDPAQRALCCPNWSTDGTQLHMHGAYAGPGATPLYRVTLATGAVERMAVGRQRFTNVLPLPGGDLLCSSTAPSLARVSAAGRVLAEALPPNGDFRFADWSLFRIDAEGTRVVVPLSADGSHLRFFDLGGTSDRTTRQATPADAAALAPPRRSGVSVEAVLDEFGYKHPVRINGKALRLKPFQPVLSWAAGPDAVAMGTRWSVLSADLQGNITWERSLPAPAYQVNVSGDGRFVVVAVGDGTLRWFAADSGREVLGLFLHANGTDWIAWRADGFYASSPGGDQYLAWLVNRGDEQSPDLLQAVQFERNLYRPDLLRAALRSDGARGASGRAAADLRAALQAPRVRIEGIDESQRRIRFRVEPGAGALQRVGIYADGLPLLDATAQRAEVAAAGSVRTVTVPAGLPLDRIRVEAETDHALGIDEAAALVPAPAVRTPARLWLLTIGVEKFPDFAGCGTARNCSVRVPELPNAPVDARVIAQALRDKASGLFSEVRATVLAHRFGTVPTKAAIVAALKDLEQAAPEDTVLVFVGSHGFAGGAGAAPEYYFLPADALESSLARLFAESRGQVPPPGSSMDSLLSASELTDALRRVPGRRILAIDTCHAGAAGVSSNPYSIAKRSASSQFAVLSASTGDELSYEYIDPKVPHGGFTYALINGLRGAADGDRDGRTTLDELFAFIGPEVRRNVDALNAEERRQNPKHRELTQTPVLYASPVLRASVLAGAR